MFTNSDFAGKVITLRRTRLVQSREILRNNRALVGYEAIANALSIVDTNGYPLPNHVLKKTFELVEQFGNLDDFESLQFSGAYKLYMSSKNTALGDGGILTDPLSKQ